MKINGVAFKIIILVYFQCRRLPNYFLQNVNHFRGKSPAALDSAAKSIWRLFRELITNPDALETL